MSSARFGSVLITGANRGIGLAFAKHFAEKNSTLNKDIQTKVIATSRNLSDGLDALLDHNNVYYIPLDVTNDESIKSMSAIASDIVGNNGLNVLINNAGIMKPSKLLRTSSADLRESFDVNVIGPCTMITSLQSLLKKGAKVNKDLPHSFSRAGILNLSAEISSITKTNNTMMAPYKMSKAALNMLTKCSAVDLMKFDILCAGVHPGWVQTDMGGAKAPLSADKAAKNIVNFMGAITKDQNGLLFTTDMKKIPF